VRRGDRRQRGLFRAAGVLIRPLTPGSHRLLFSGTITFTDGSTFVINTDYRVTVGH
jgi:hypothetical protein